MIRCPAMQLRGLVLLSLAGLGLAAAAAAQQVPTAWRSVKLEDFEATGFDLLGQNVEILGDYSSLMPIAPNTAANIVDPRMSLGRKALSDPALAKQLRGVDPGRLPKVSLDMARTPDATFQWFLQNGCREHCEGVYFRGVVAKHRVNQMPALQLLDASRTSLASAGAEKAAPPSSGRAGVGAALLFAKGSGPLTSAEQEEVFRLLELEVSPDGKELLDPVCRQPIQFPEVSFEDLNGDGAPEIFAIYGNTCMSGGTGSNIALVRRGANGRFGTHLGFPAAGYRILGTKSRGFPDLQIGGMGFCEAVWRWDGAAYQHLRNQPTGPDGCKHVDGATGP